MKNCNKQGGFFHNAGYTKEQRRNMYYWICIIIRLLFGVLISYFASLYPKSKHKYLYLILGILSIGYLIGNIYFMNERPCVWWNREIHIGISLLILMLCFKGYNYNQDYLGYVSLLLFLDVLLPLQISLIKKPFE